jgi:hypothetical protein
MLSRREHGHRKRLSTLHAESEFSQRVLWTITLGKHEPAHPRFPKLVRACKDRLASATDFPSPTQTVKMNELFEEFVAAYTSRNGYELAQTISPVPSSGQPHKLVSIFQSTNSHSVRGDIKHFIKHNAAIRKSLSQDEVSGWVDVYTAYWKALGEIVSGETGKVRMFVFSPIFAPYLTLNPPAVILDQGVRFLERAHLSIDTGLHQSWI